MKTIFHPIGAAAVLAVAGITAASTAVAAYPGWYGELQEYQDCRSAVELDLGTARTVRVNKTYWRSKRGLGAKNLLLNARVLTTAQRMHSKCALRRNGRVMDVASAPGWYVERQGKVTIEPVN